MKKALAILIFSVVLIAGLGVGLFSLYSLQSREKAEEPAAAEINTSTSASSDNGTAPAGNKPDLMNIAFVLDGKAITLVNGLSEVEAAPGSASKITTRLFGNEACGDLNGDEKEDAAFLITSDGGGSGTFFYVVAALQSDGGAVGTNAMLLGDRIAPQTTGIENGTITVNFADRRPDEPFTTAPSVGMTKYLKVEGGKLVETGQP